jgi:FkbM family methyltransferase
MNTYNIFHGEVHQGNPVDQILRQYFPKNTGVFFDVGAFEPIRISNSYHFEQNGWDCYCFEANTNLIPLLKSKRKNVYNYAISNENKDNVSFNIVHTNWDGGDWTASYSAINLNDDYKKVFPMPAHQIEVINVPQKTLNSIIDTDIPEVKSIDILSIDVEGGEMNVLYGLDLIKYTPKVIVIENVTNDSNINNYLQSAGYRLDKHISYNQFFVHNTYNN